MPQATTFVAQATGLVVEEIEPKGAAREAGVERGDVFLSWHTEEAEGRLRSPFDLGLLELRVGGRASVLLRGSRDDRPLSLELRPGDWGLLAGPRLDPEARDRYQEALRLIEGEQFEVGVEELRRLAVASGAFDPTDLGAWLFHAAARRLAERGEWGRVARLYDEAIGLVGASERAALLNSAHAELLFAAGRFREAAGAHERSLTLWQDLSPDGFGVAVALSGLGMVAHGEHDLTLAEERIRQSLAMRERLAPGSVAVATSLTELAWVPWGRSQLEQAQQMLEQALQILERVIPESSDTADRLNHLGVVKAMLSDLEAAEGDHRRALAIRQRLDPDSLDVAASMNNLGMVARERGDLLLAEEYYRQALAICRRLAPDSEDLARSLNNLGIVAWERGDLAQAGDSFLRALEIFERHDSDSTSVAASQSNLGIIARSYGDWERAERYYRQALEIRQRFEKSGLSVANSLNNLGNLASVKGDLEQAREHHQASLAIKERLAPDSLTVANSLAELAAVATAAGDWPAADRAYRRALEIRRRLAPNSIAVAESLHGLGELARERGELTQAESHLRRALALRERRAPGSWLEAESAAELGRVYRLLGDDGRALELLASAVDSLEIQAGRLGGVEEDRARFQSRSVATYRELVDLLVELGRGREAFHTLERSRARNLLAMLAERDLFFRAAAPAELEHRRRRAAVDYDRVQSALNAIGDEAGEIDRLLEELADLDRERAEIREEMRRRAPRLAALHYPEPLDLEGVQRALDPGTVVLSYSVGAERTHLFVIDARARLQVFTLGVGEASVGKETERFRRLIAAQIRGESDRDEVHAQGQHLFQTLVAPAAPSIEASERLLIVPDGPLHTLPFAALVTTGGDAPPRYLVEWKSLHVAVSLTVYDELKRQRPPGRRGEATIVAFGDPDYGSTQANRRRDTGDPVLRSLAQRGWGFAPLPATRKEATSIAALYGDNATLLLGADASEEQARRVGINTTLLHFAAHGVLDQRFPLNSAVALSLPAATEAAGENGLLQAWEVLESVRLDADLVTLSACDSGLGSPLAGEGLIGLTRAFHYAGARTVLASLWSVADSSTAELMTRFYSYFKDGKPKAEALRAAQLDLIRGRSQTARREPDTKRAVAGLVPSATSPSAPFHWAAFVLSGDWK